MCLVALVSVIGTTAWALDKVGGYYQIGSADDFKEFAALVNDGETYANAVLTADIDLGLDGTMIGCDANRFRGIFDGKGHSITVNSFPEADGQAIFRNIEGNALVQNLKVKGTITTKFKYAAGIAAWGKGTIRNCWVDLTVESTVEGDATHGGVVGVGSEGLVVENCLVQFTVNGARTENCGGVCGWQDGKLSVANCLVIVDGTLKTPSDCGTISRNPGNLAYVDIKEYTGVDKENFEVGYGWRPRGASYNNFATKEWKQHDGQCTIVSNDAVASGQICYQLNHDQSTIAWVQNLGEDAIPVPAVFGAGKKQVFASASTNCMGQAEAEITYSNDGADMAVKHTTDKFGVCTTCGHMVFEGLERDLEDNSYIARTAADLDWLEGRNRVGNGGWFNISLGNDIEYVAEPGKLIFNNDNWYGGNIDGRGHKLTFEVSDIDYDHAGFIPHMRGSIRNMVFDGTVKSFKNNAGIVVGTSEGDTHIDNVEVHGFLESAGQYAGTVVGRLGNGGVTMNNVYSDADFHATHSGDNTSGGIVGLPDKDWRLTNVIYAGNITAEPGAECIGSFAGWSSGNGHLTNVAFIGEMSGMSGDSHAISRNPGKVNFYSKFYYVNDFPAGDVKIADNEAAAMEQVSADDVASGRLAFLLNGSVQGGENFYQVIGTDKVPMPFAKEGGKVYVGASSYLCDGTPVGDVSYTNTEAGSTIPDHSYTEDGFCSVCGKIQEDFMTPAEDGVFEVSTPEQLRWWSYYASTVDLGASVRLTEDIDMESIEEIEAENGKVIKPYALIGNEATPFYGSFDGQFHTISNLVIDYPGNRGVGLIGVMNSRASKTDGISDANARDAVGTYIKNVVMDETCEIIGGGYAGLVGMTAEWAGHVTFQNVGLDCTVRCMTGANAGGVLGCVMGSTCHITIDNCYMTGDVFGVNENGAFSGWLGSYAEIKNCYAIGSVEKPEAEDTHKYFARYSSAKITNCYTLNGGTVNETDHFVGQIKEEDIETGKLCYLLNGSQFKDCFYYQNIDEDMHPVANPSHGRVAYLGDVYYGITDENLAEVAAEVKAHYEEKYITDQVAYKEALENYQAALNTYEECTTVEEFADTIDAANKVKEILKKSIATYKAYMDKCASIKDYLNTHDDFEGEQRDALAEYLDGSDEPSEENPLGQYEYVIEGDAPDSLIVKETARVEEWLQKAIATGYKAGTEVTNLITNANFGASDRNANWTNGFATSTGKLNTEDADAAKLIGVEAWDKTGDMYQTVEGMKPGYYLVGINGAFRPSNNRYSVNYAAGIYANGTFNYFPTVFEDYVAANDTVDQENVNLHGSGALDLRVYSDGTSTNDDEAAQSGADLLGFAVHGPAGIAAAANSNRHQVYTLAKVGEDGKLTIGIKNPGSKYGSDWTGWSNLKVVYYGDEPAAAIAKVAENMKARANVLIEHEEYDDITPAKDPNYPAELRTALAAAVKEDASEELVAKFSDLFEQVYEGKQAYIALYSKATQLQHFGDCNYEYIDEEGIPTGETLFSKEEMDLVENAADELLDAYLDGTYSVEKAKAVDVPTIVGNMAPAQDSEGYFLLSSPKHLAVFSALSAADYTTKAKLAGNIDMTGLAMQPINTWDYSYRGVFDGQGYAIENVNIDFTDPDHGRCGLFNTLDHATVKNLKLTGKIQTGYKYMGTIAGYTYGATIENCDIAMTMISTVSGDGTHGGIVGHNAGSDTKIRNCRVNNEMIGESTNSCGGICGWTGTSTIEMKNILILSKYGIDKGSCDVTSRHGDGDTRTISNVYYVNDFGTATGTKVNVDQLKSGEVTYKLNGSQSEDVAWFQTLPTDTLPQLFEGGTVYYYGGTYVNEKPDPQLNAYAYNITSANNIVKYTMVGDAAAAEIRFSNGYTITLSGDDLKAGEHSVPVDAAKIGEEGTEMTYDVYVESKGSRDALKMGDSYKVWAPYGLAVNNNPASVNFGQILMTDYDPVSTYGAEYFTSKKPGALFAFDGSFQPVNAADGTPGFYGELPFKNQQPMKIADQDRAINLKDVHFSADGRLFVASEAGRSNSSVYEINPDNLDEAWTPVFTGGELDEATGITYVNGEEQNRMAAGMTTNGKGEDLKLYVLGGQRSNGGFNTTDYNCSIYNLGTAKTWGAAPSADFEPLNGVYTIAPAAVSIQGDGKGGLWYIQHRGTPNATIPALKHYNAEGVEDYSDISTSLNGSKMAVSADGEYLAIPMGKKKVVVYETNYVPMANGRISLNPVATVNVEEGQISGLAFDFAGNLYAASYDSETLSRYTVPYPEAKKLTIPAAAPFKVGKSKIGDVNSDGIVDGSDIVTLVNVVINGGNGRIYDLNSSGTVDGQDIVILVNLVNNVTTSEVKEAILLWEKR